MIKGLIVTDLDGTLLDAKGRYSLQTRDFLRSLSAQGYVVVLASGRPFRSMKDLYADLGCTGPVIAYNGGLVFHPGHDEFPRYEKRFRKEDVLAIHDLAKGVVDVFMAETEERLFVEGDGSGLFPYFPDKGTDLVQGNLDQTLDEDPFTCLFHETEKESGTLKTLCATHPTILYRSWSNSNFSELALPGIHKGSALAYIMETYGLAKEDVIAFGDASNDLEMLEQAGYPFAMKNARAEWLKDRFPVTKNTVDEDGVIVQLQRILRL